MEMIGMRVKSWTVLSRSHVPSKEEPENREMAEELAIPRNTAPTVKDPLISDTPFSKPVMNSSLFSEEMFVTVFRTGKPKESSSFSGFSKVIQNSSFPWPRKLALIENLTVKSSTCAPSTQSRISAEWS